jgi:hypothetical protein
MSEMERKGMKKWKIRRNINSKKRISYHLVIPL